MRRTTPSWSQVGGMAEWSKALVLKTSEVQVSKGSNPFPSATNTLKNKLVTWKFTSLSPEGMLELTGEIDSARCPASAPALWNDEFGMRNDESHRPTRAFPRPPKGKEMNHGFHGFHG